MPPQHVEMAETAAALRRKLRRDRQSSQAPPAQIATNRGNKLKPGARYVRAGSLAWRYGAGHHMSASSERSSWTERVNHAGYNRDVLARNPRRYNEYGDELEDSDSDSDADADAEEENPYGEVRLAELLKPLTHPSELASHPSMAQAYLDPALPDMVLATDAKIREERNNLWRAKNLYRYFTGDETWIPCEMVEADNDWELFEPNPGFVRRLESGESPTKRRRLDANGHVDGDGQLADTFDGEAATRHTLNGSLNHLQAKTGEIDKELENTDLAEEQAGDVSMMEVEGLQPKPEPLPQTNGVHKEEEAESIPTEPVPAQQIGHGVIPEGHADARPGDETAPKDEADNAMAQNTSNPSHLNNENASDGDNEEDEPDRSSAASTPPAPPRRITRALAAEAETASNAQIASPPATSPTLSSHSPSTFEPHPLFLLPPALATAHAPHHNYAMSMSLAHSGLPPEELLETRKLLSLYIQKSEETIRGLENIQGKLIKAKRRREKLWSWCVAEGHVGEMSDGEDWIDTQYWGLETGELRKGRDEDAAAVNETVGAGATGAAVSNGGAPAGEAEDTSVIIGGRKGKRRGRAKD